MPCVAFALLGASLPFRLLGYDTAPGGGGKGREQQVDGRVMGGFHSIFSFLPFPSGDVNHYWLIAKSIKWASTKLFIAPSH